MSATPAYPVRAPQWSVAYQGVNISGEIAPMVRRITYVDRLSAASGEVEVEVEDREHRWQGPWYPALGDVMNVMIGYQGEPMLPCGDFELDDLELAGPPDVFRMRALAAYVTPAMRTANSVGYENQTLLGIAAEIAGKYGLGMVSAPEIEDVAFARVTQDHETDLAFLKRLAIEHGYDFTVRGAAMVFFAVAALEASPPAATVVRPDAERFEFRNRTRKIYSGAQVAYFDPAAKQLITAAAAPNTPAPTGDTLKIVTRCENAAQAALKAGAALHRHNMLFTTARLVLPGAPILAAGTAILLSGWGTLDGTYLIEVARHELSRGRGFTTAIEARRLA
jgi:Bacteriophage probable baseplate hub protein